jgi:hypothetical protein
LIISAAAKPIRLFSAGLQLLVSTEGREAAERFVQHRLDLNSAAVSSAQESCPFKIAKFAANRRGRTSRSAQRVAQLLPLHPVLADVGFLYRVRFSALPDHQITLLKESAGKVF